jgi:hypothetical protein
MEPEGRVLSRGSEPAGVSGGDCSSAVGEDGFGDGIEEYARDGVWVPELEGALDAGRE